MRERVVTFGDANTLVGILTEAEGRDAASGMPGVLILNSGILHRVGANRLHVRMARRLADRGFTALRFDHAGIGDSGARRDDRPFRESAIEEVRAAMDLLHRTRGHDRFLLAGLCSGSDAAFWTALEDPRVCGLIQLDPFLYRTPRFRVRHYLPRLLSPRAWVRSVSSRFTHWLRDRRARREGAEMGMDWTAPQYTRIFPPRAEVAHGLSELAGRGVSFFVFISGSMTEYVNYPEQYRESFPEVAFGDRLQVTYRPQADHTITDLEEQGRVLTSIEEWAASRWPAPGHDEASALSTGSSHPHPQEA